MYFVDLVERVKVPLGLAIILIAGFQYLYWFGEGGYKDHLQLTQKIQQQAEINNDLKERNRVFGRGSV